MDFLLTRFLENAELAARRAIRMNSMAIQRHDQARVNAVFGLSGASVVDETETLSEDEQTPGTTIQASRSPTLLRPWHSSPEADSSCDPGCACLLLDLF